MQIIMYCSTVSTTNRPKEFNIKGIEELNSKASYLGDIGLIPN